MSSADYLQTYLAEHNTLEESFNRILSLIFSRSVETSS